MGTRSWVLLTLTATELGVGSQVSRWRAEHRDGNMCACHVQGGVQKTLYSSFSSPPSSCGLVWDRLSLVLHPVTPTSSLWAFHSSLRMERGSVAGLPAPGNPSSPPAHPFPTELLLSTPLSPGSRLGVIRGLQPPREPGRASRGLFSAPSP